MLHNTASLTSAPLKRSPLYRGGVRYFPLCNSVKKAIPFNHDGLEYTVTLAETTWFTILQSIIPRCRPLWWGRHIDYTTGLSKSCLSGHHVVRLTGYVRSLVILAVPAGCLKRGYHRKLPRQVGWVRFGTALPFKRVPALEEDEMFSHGGGRRYVADDDLCGGVREVSFGEEVWSPQASNSPHINVSLWQDRRVCHDDFGSLADGDDRSEALLNSVCLRRCAHGRNNPVPDSWFQIQDRHLAQARGVCYTTTRRADSAGGEAPRQTDLFQQHKRGVDTETNTAHEG